MQFRGTPIRVTLEGDELTVVALEDGFSQPVRVGAGDDIKELGTRRRLHLHRRGPGRRRLMAGFRGAIFDVDGVLVDSPHERAWRDTLRELIETRWADIRGQLRASPERFTRGSTRTSCRASRAWRRSRRARLLRGAGSRAAEVAYGERKQQMVLELIEAGEFNAYPDALRFVLAVRDAGIPMAAASSSKNAGLSSGGSGWTRLPTSRDSRTTSSGRI